MLIATLPCPLCNAEVTAVYRENDVWRLSDHRQPSPAEKKKKTPKPAAATPHKPYGDWCIRSGTFVEVPNHAVCTPLTVCNEAIGASNACHGSEPAAQDAEPTASDTGQATDEPTAPGA